MEWSSTRTEKERTAVSQAQYPSLPYISLGKAVSYAECTVVLPLGLVRNFFEGCGHSSR